MLAESLFREAKTLLDAGNAAAACPKLEESQRLDPGGGTLLNLAVCHERLGKLATAWAEYDEALALARRDGRKDRAKLADERVKALAPRLPRLTVEVGDARPPELEVTLDGSKVPSAAWGTGMPVDPGEHEVIARAPGFKTYTAHVTVTPEGAPGVVTVPPLEKEPAKPSPDVPPKDDVGPPIEIMPKAPTAEPETEYFVPQRIAGITLTTFGAVGILVGGGAGVAAIVKKNESDERCTDVACSTSEGVRLTDQSLVAAHVSTASFVIGGAALVTGIVVWATATSEVTTPAVVFVPILGRDGGGAWISAQL